MDMNEVNQLAKTFTTACKDTVKKSKVKAYTGPIVLVAIMALLGGPGKGLAWMPN